MDHTPLHRLTENDLASTGGRLVSKADDWRLTNAFCSLHLCDADGRPRTDDWTDESLVRVVGRRIGDEFHAESVDVVRRPETDRPQPGTDRDLPIGRALQARHRLHDRIRAFFDDREFLEVQTRAMTPAPGTDPHIDPVPARFRQDPSGDRGRDTWLHTSPELQMKRLLTEGAGPIYQLGRAWRNGEVTDHHSPEFTLLEWYRPWEDVDAIIEDVQALVCRILDEDSDRPTDPPIRRMPMHEVVDRACGFDIRQALDADSLRAEIRRRDLLSDRHMEAARWDELFFSLNVNHLDPYLADQGAVFVTDWPRPLAILAQNSAEDPRVAERFELYVDGVELANGFGELTDPDEQRRRFTEDNRTRRDLDLDQMPMPEAFVRSLRWGMPPSAGVALGVDRLLMVATEGADSMRDVCPFAVYRALEGLQWP